MAATAERTVLESWEALCADPRFQGLPYKIETDEHGRILMSPTLNYHGFCASRINRLLERLMPNGETGNEVAVVTARGIKVPDCVWLSPKRYRKAMTEAACSTAPETCVEILSKGNSEEEVAEKRELYFAAGAAEVWVCDARGGMRFFGASGEMKASALCARFPRTI